LSVSASSFAVQLPQEIAKIAETGRKEKRWISLMDTRVGTLKIFCFVFCAFFAAVLAHVTFVLLQTRLYLRNESQCHAC